MARSRKADQPQEGDDFVPEQPGSTAADNLPTSEATEGERKAWTGRIGGGWTDAQAGVHVIEDQQNGA
jgi:hypothetical protein